MYSKQSRGKYTPLLPSSLNDINLEQNMHTTHSKRTWAHVIKTCLMRLAGVLFALLFLFLLVSNLNTYQKACNQSTSDLLQLQDASVLETSRLREKIAKLESDLEKQIRISKANLEQKEMVIQEMMKEMNIGEIKFGKLKEEINSSLNTQSHAKEKKQLLEDAQKKILDLGTSLVVERRKFKQLKSDCSAESDVMGIVEVGDKQSKNLVSKHGSKTLKREDVDEDDLEDDDDDKNDEDDDETDENEEDEDGFDDEDDFDDEDEDDEDEDEFDDEEEDDEDDGDEDEEDYVDEKDEEI